MKSRLWIAGILLAIVGIIVTSVALLNDSNADESSIVVENPILLDLSDTDSEDWCSEHSVPESECTKCNTSLIDKYKASGDWCVGHSLPESHCRLCNPGIKFPQENSISIARAVRQEGSSHETPRRCA